MVPDTPNLLPEKHPQGELFLCDVADAALKDLAAHMEHPFYSLSKKPDRAIRRYQNGPNWLEIVPSVKGIATIYDKDILIFCISQVMAKRNRGETVAKRVRIRARELLMFCNRGTSGKDYAALCEALDRLDGTRIRTNIRRGDNEEFSAFGLIDSAAVARKFGLDGRLQWCDVVLSDWVFEAIKRADVLTLHRDYFRLRKPIERRIYEIARKHCGRQAYWSITLPALLKKTGAKSPEKKFRFIVKEIGSTNHLPDYYLRYEPDSDSVVFSNRGSIPKKRTSKKTKTIRRRNIQLSELHLETYEIAKRKAPGMDVYSLEKEWRSWAEKQDTPPEDSDAAFIGFCAKKAKKTR